MNLQCPDCGNNTRLRFFASGEGEGIFMECPDCNEISEVKTEETIQ